MHDLSDYRPQSLVTRDYREEMVFIKLQTTYILL